MKQTKTAEQMLSDADKFPKETMREMIARRYGIDAVAISGPCEGKNLATCIVEQLEKRWNRIKDRFASDHNKVQKLAFKIAESYMQKDDTEKCVSDLLAQGWTKEAANGIASYMKAYAVEAAADNEITAALKDVLAQDEAPDSPFGDEGGGSDEGSDAPIGGDEPKDEGTEETTDALPAPEGDADDEMDEVSLDSGPEGDTAPDMGGGDMGGAPEPMDDTVTVELPAELAQQLHEQIETQMGEKAHGDIVPGGEMHGDMPPAGGAMDVEVVEMPGQGIGGGQDIGGQGIGQGMGGGQDIVPGEPAADAGGPGQSVETEMAAGHNCASCGQPMKKKEKEMAQAPGGMPAPGGGMGAAAAAITKPQKMSASNMRAGHIKSAADGGSILRTTVAYENEYEGKGPKDYNKPIGDSKGGDGMLRLNNPMHLNNTDQLLHMEGKELGDAKEKSPEEPKALEEGNVHTEAYSAGDNKFSDGKTMGHEPSFSDVKGFDRASATGGEKSIMGKDESYPKDEPKVPAGSSPIGGEVWTGGDVSRKGTVIASITGVTIIPTGVLVETNVGKKFLAKAAIKNDKALIAKIQSGLEKIKETDPRKYAEQAALIVKAETSGKTDNVTKIDTSKLEAEKFTNDGKKEPVEGGAMTGKGKGEDQHKSPDIPKTNTSKLEAEKFTNDAEKKAESDDKTRGYAAVAGKQTKTAEPVDAGPKDYNKEVKHSGDKEVGKPKPVDEQIESEGYMAGGDKVQDGKTLGHEPKFDPKTVSKDSVSGGDSSLLGKDESFPKDTPKVPAGGGQMGHEPWEGGNVETKGTTIANPTQKRQLTADEVEAKLAEAKVEKARLQAASFYVADLLRNNEINESDFAKEMEKVSSYSVPMIQSLIVTTRKARERASIARNAQQDRRMEKVASGSGLTMPIVIPASNNNETSLVQKLVAEFKLTKDLNTLDELRERENRAR